MRKIICFLLFIYFNYFLLFAQDQNSFLFTILTAKEESQKCYVSKEIQDGSAFVYLKYAKDKNEIINYNVYRLSDCSFLIEVHYLGDPTVEDVEHLLSMSSTRIERAMQTLSRRGEPDPDIYFRIYTGEERKYSASAKRVGENRWPSLFVEKKSFIRIKF